MVIGGPAADLGKAYRLEPECLIFHFPPPNDERNSDTDCRERQ